MIGAIAGDIIGSRYEAFPTKERDFPLFQADCRFTDDTVLTVAVADWILNGGDLVDKFHAYVARYPNAGYGMSFVRWASRKDRQPYGSWGNGAAMRVSPVGFVFDSLEVVLAKARETAAVTHNHEEGIRGAQATATAIFLARNGYETPNIPVADDLLRRQSDQREDGWRGAADHREDANRLKYIKDEIQSRFGYDLNRTMSDIRPTYSFDSSCQGSVPESIIAFLESKNYEEAVRNAVSLGGDADTMACIAGGIAEAYYGGVPHAIRKKTFQFLDARLTGIVHDFAARFMDEEQAS